MKSEAEGRGAERKAEEEGRGLTEREGEGAGEVVAVLVEEGRPLGGWEVGDGSECLWVR